MNTPVPEYPGFTEEEFEQIAEAFQGDDFKLMTEDDDMVSFRYNVSGETITIEKYDCYHVTVGDYSHRFGWGMIDDLVEWVFDIL